jgi:hypothetical protein
MQSTDELLKHALDLVEDVDNERATTAEVAEAGESLAGVFTALDGALRSGEPLPAAWVCRKRPNPFPGENVYALPHKPSGQALWNRAQELWQRATTSRGMRG